MESTTTTSTNVSIGGAATGNDVKTMKEEQSQQQDELLLTPPNLKDAKHAHSSSLQNPVIGMDDHEQTITNQPQAAVAADALTSQAEEQVEGTKVNDKENTPTDNSNESKAVTTKPKKKSSWLMNTLSPSRRKLKQKETSTNKSDNDNDNDTKSIKQEEAKETCQEGKQLELVEATATSPVESKVPDQEQAKLPAPRKPAIKNSKHTSSLVELVTVAEGIEAVKDAESRQFSRTVSFDEIVSFIEGQVSPAPAPAPAPAQSTTTETDVTVNQTPSMRDETPAVESEPTIKDADPEQAPSNDDSKVQVVTEASSPSKDSKAHVATGTLSSPSKESKKKWWKTSSKKILSPFRLSKGDSKASNNKTTEVMNAPTNNSPAKEEVPDQQPLVTQEEESPPLQGSVSTEKLQEFAKEPLTQQLTLVVSQDVNEEHSKDQVEDFLEDVVDPVVQAEMTAWIQDMANVVVAPETTTTESSMTPDTTVAAAADKDSEETQNVATEPILHFAKQPTPAHQLDEPTENNQKPETNVKPRVSRSMLEHLHLRFLVNMLLLFTTVGWGCQFYLASSPRILDGFCSPVPESINLGHTDSHVTLFEAPWWAPHDETAMSKKLFHMVCGQRPRVKLEWQLVKARKRRGNLYRLLIVDSDFEDDANSESNGIFVDMKNLVELRVFPEDDMIAVNGKHSEQKIAAPWQKWKKQV